MCWRHRRSRKLSENQRTPSGSPGNLSTLFCSQLSRSFAAILCYMSVKSHSTISWRPYVVFLSSVEFPPFQARSVKSILFANPCSLPIMILIALSGDWRENKASGNNHGDEGQSEQKEWMLADSSSEWRSQFLREVSESTIHAD